MRAQTELPESVARQKPDGGYVQIATRAIALLWWAYAQHKIGLRALRVGLALYEIRIRRRAHAWTERKRGNKPAFTPNYSAKELADFCGLPTKRVVAALDELTRLGFLVEFAPEGFALASSIEQLNLTPNERGEFRAWADTLTRRKRIPIPRRILTLACESPSPALIAVILGVCLRCAWLKPGLGCSYSGRMSCRWLARNFGLSIRALQAAKSHLVGLNWIQTSGDINRFGERLEINPAWQRLLALENPRREDPQDQESHLEEGRGGDPGTNSAPPPEPTGTNSAGVSLIRESLPSEEYKDQENLPPTGSRSGPGFFKYHSEKDPDQKSPEQTLPAPRLSDIRPERDFPDTGRCLELFRQAVKCGLMPNASEHSRLLWMAAIERARTVTARNPAGVFLALVKNRLWKNLSEGQFDAANRRLKDHLYALPAELPPLFVPRSKPEPPKPPPLSQDALLVKVVRSKLGSRGEGNLLFHALRVHAGFSRERFDAALAELDRRPSACESAGPSGWSTVGGGLGLS